MENQHVIGFGRLGAQKAFLDRNRKFVEHLSTLMGTCAKVLLPPVTGTKPTDGLVFFLNRLIAEEFSEVLLLAANGYGMAAKRLVRGQYERLVASSYIEEDSGAAERFINFGEVQRVKS